MTFKFNKIKTFVKEFDFQKAKNVTGEYAKKYYKVAGSAAVVTALCVICAVSAVNKAHDMNRPSGVMMTLADVAVDEAAYNGQLCEVSGTSYETMTSINYETEQLANLEVSERYVDGILSSGISDERAATTIGQLTAERTVSTSVSSIQTVEDTTTEQTTTEAPVQAEPVVIVADANGSYRYAGTFTLTAYCPCAICCGAYSNPANPTTASGTVATAGRTIAADTSVFGFGTQLMINGQIYTVEDRGGAINGNKIDIYFNTHAEALAFGRRTADVYVVQ